jgi:DNA-binding LytR/AlgR family response regulator
MSDTEGKYKVLIVDDNKIARILLMQLLKQVPSIIVDGECDNALEAATILNRNEIDILFLDIEMPGMNGIELLRSLSLKPLTILTSANKGYGPEAYELNVVDYLVKPLHMPRMMMAVKRALELLNRRDVYLKEIHNDFIFIKENKIIRKIATEDIYILESKGDYVKIFMADKSYVVHSTLKMFEGKLSPAKFLRAHRSFILAVDKIDYIEENVVYLNNMAVPISESFRTQFIKNLNFL